MTEEKKNNAQQELSEQELEGVSGGLRGIGPSIPVCPKPRTLLCPNCKSDKTGKAGANSYRCRDCGCEFKCEGTKTKFL